MKLAQYAKIFQSKKGLELNELYQFVLLIVLVGMVIGVGVLSLDKFSTSSGVTATAATAINNTRVEIANIASNWMGLIVTVAVLSIILFLVVRSFGAAGR
ncbi:MAG: hypothetical protein A2W74_00410 [Planctomycetes bacterium RIFCSPLOWO2_12_38_17]|nr:MAG: hypothetical protein UT69_C0031G0003 [Candidatus Yanofskybacteria bacterium GW2011_GWE1_40_10]OHB97964.1 MAG: hypothetical protein A2W74_00410 [Planctomycetes bacterium RIFCSPLOWO2_12_38_17]